MIRLIQLAEQPERSESVMNKIVRKSLTERKPTARRKQELAKLAARPEREIDLSDIPELTDNFWRNAMRNPFYRPIKKQVTLRLDADVLAWLRKQGKRLSDQSQFPAPGDHGKGTMSTRNDPLSRDSPITISRTSRLQNTARPGGDGGTIFL